MTAAEVSLRLPRAGWWITRPRGGRVTQISLGADLRLCSGYSDSPVPFGWESAASPGPPALWTPSLPLLLTGTWWAGGERVRLVAKKLVFKARFHHGSHRLCG